MQKARFGGLFFRLGRVGRPMLEVRGGLSHQIRGGIMNRWIGMGLLALLAGCGAETVGTAAVQASLKAQEAEQAKQVQQDVQRQMEAMQQLQQQRLEEAAKAAEGQ
jgi:hypothetical protein